MADETAEDALVCRKGRQEERRAVEVDWALRQLVIQTGSRVKDRTAAAEGAPSYLIRLAYSLITSRRIDEAQGQPARLAQKPKRLG